jgi:hypothetical protein
MPATTYYALLFDGRTVEQPSGVLRRLHTEPAPVDEAFGRDLAWHPTPYISMHFMNQLDWDLEEIDEATATAVIERWKQEWDEA